MDGAYFGVSIDWSHDGAAAYAERLGRKPAVYVEFAPFPIDENAGRALDAAVASIREQRAMLLLTLEPHAGFGSVTAPPPRIWADGWQATTPAASRSSSGSPMR